MQLLNDYPQGKLARDIAVVLDIDPRSASRLLQNMRAIDVVKSIDERAGSCRRVRYYLEQHKEAAMKAHEADKGITWGSGVGTRAQVAAGFHATQNKKVKYVGEVVCNVKVKKLKPGVDMRYYVETPEPVFSAMKPGEYLANDTAIARAYA